MPRGVYNDYGSEPFTAPRLLYIHILYNCDVIMGAMASLITSLTSVYSTVHCGADQRKHQSSVSLAFVRGLHRRPVNSPYKWLVTQKMFPFDDVIATSENTPLLQDFSQWRVRFKWKLYCHCMKNLRQRYRIIALSCISMRPIYIEMSFPWIVANLCPHGPYIR